MHITYQNKALKCESEKTAKEKDFGSVMYC